MRHILAVALLVASTIAAPAVTFVRDGNRVILTGQIRQGDGVAFAAIAAALPDGIIIVLGLDGGVVPDAISIGRIIRERKFRTLVPSQCMSACLMIFAGGASRELGEGARLGVHCARRLDDLAHCDKAATSDMAAFLRQMRMPQTIVQMQEQAGLEITPVPAAALK